MLEVMICNLIIWTVQATICIVTGSDEDDGTGPHCYAS
jgi:hypothetical protein